ncbi:MAG: ribbon-helix-helix domain-containing protein [Alphaproteobacteria bacterium]|nr:ribbon-helix-helix domain-containing protein [Alphaproteobacteria bacterium]
MIKVSVLIANRHATSITIEEEFFEALLDIAAEMKLSRNQLITLIDRTRTAENLSSAVRIYILQYYQKKLTAPK